MFLRWLNENNAVAFEGLLNQKESDFAGKHPLIITEDYMVSTAESDAQMGERYKRLADGFRYADLLGKTSAEDIFIFINQSAEYTIRRIGQIMQLVNIPGESVLIELK